MQLHEKIARARKSYRATKPRSTRRSEIHRDLVWLMVKQLKRENRRERRR
jgi:hypothetical protein